MKLSLPSNTYSPPPAGSWLPSWNDFTKRWALRFVLKEAKETDWQTSDGRVPDSGGLIKEWWPYALIFFRFTFSSFSLLAVSELEATGRQQMRKGMVVRSHQGDERPVLQPCSLFKQKQVTSVSAATVMKQVPSIICSEVTRAAGLDPL